MCLLMCVWIFICVCLLIHACMWVCVYVCVCACVWFHVCLRQHRALQEDFVSDLRFRNRNCGCYRGLRNDVIPCSGEVFSLAWSWGRDNHSKASGRQGCVLCTWVSHVLLGCFCILIRYALMQRSVTALCVTFQKRKDTLQWQSWPLDFESFRNIIFSWYI